MQKLHMKDFAFNFFGVYHYHENKLHDNSKIEFCISIKTCGETRKTVIDQHEEHVLI